MIEPITEYDNWYRDLYKKCFDKDDMWFSEIIRNRYQGYHINKVAFHVENKIIDDEMEILSIGVHPNFRLQGLAKLLLKDRISKFKKVFLEVSSNNVNAIQLYKTLKFEQINFRKNYYQDSDALLMKYESQ